MENVATKHAAVLACDGCRREALVLRVMDGAKLCDRCAETSARIDQKLVNVSSEDLVTCENPRCRAVLDFDARIALITRECGGVVLCDHCKPVSIEGEAS